MIKSQLQWPYLCNQHYLYSQQHPDEVLLFSAGVLPLLADSVSRLIWQERACPLATTWHHWPKPVTWVICRRSHHLNTLSTYLTSNWARFYRNRIVESSLGCLPARFAFLKHLQWLMIDANHQSCSPRGLLHALVDAPLSNLTPQRPDVLWLTFNSRWWVVCRKYMHTGSSARCSNSQPHSIIGVPLRLNHHTHNLRRPRGGYRLLILTAAFRRLNWDVSEIESLEVSDGPLSRSQSLILCHFHLYKPQISSSAWRLRDRHDVWMVASDLYGLYAVKHSAQPQLLCGNDRVGHGSKMSKMVKKSKSDTECLHPLTLKQKNKKKTRLYKDVLSPYVLSLHILHISLCNRYCRWKKKTGGLMIIPVERPKATSSLRRTALQSFPACTHPAFSHLHCPHPVPYFLSFHIVSSSQPSNYWKHLLKCLQMSLPITRASTTKPSFTSTPLCTP